MSDCGLCSSQRRRKGGDKMRDRDLDDLMGMPQLPPVPAGRLKEIESAIIGDLKPVRPLAPASAYIAAFAAIFTAACAVSCYLIAGQAGWNALTGTERLLVFVPLLAATLLGVVSIVRQMAPAARFARTTVELGAGLFVLLIVIMTAIFHPVREATFVGAGLGCFRLGMFFAVPTAALFAMLLARGAGLSPTLTGATAGGLSGLAGLAVLEIHCPNLNLLHILAWHISVVLVCAAAGILISSATFRLSHVRR